MAFLELVKLESILGDSDIDLDSLVYIPDNANAEYKKLLNYRTANTTGRSMGDPDQSTYTPYQVPAGKQFIILGFIITPTQVSGTVTLFQGDVEDSNSGEVDKFVFRSLDSATASTKFNTILTPNLPTIASSKYVNVKVSSSTGGNIVAVMGFEEDN